MLSLSLMFGLTLFVAFSRRLNTSPVVRLTVHQSLMFGLTLFVACSRRLNTSPVVRSTVHQSLIFGLTLFVACSQRLDSQYLASCEFVGDRYVFERLFAFELGTAAIRELKQMSNGEVSLFL